MLNAIEHFVRALKATRERRGLSQRALGKLIGVPQSHISKIESGSVDLRLSSLIEMARVLGLEPVLVPARAVSAVKAIVRSWESATSGVKASTLESLRPAYKLDDDEDE